MKAWDNIKVADAWVDNVFIILVETETALYKYNLFEINPEPCHRIPNSGTKRHL
jgi:hypothetical protein